MQFSIRRADVRSPIVSGMFSRCTAVVWRAITIGACAFAVASPRAHAQGAQKYGLQLSVLSTSIRLGEGNANSGGIGIEPQPGDDEITIAGGFVETRWVPVLPYERFFPYLAGRIAVLNQSNNFGTSSSGLAYGAGGGVAYVVNSRLNIDAGVTLVRQQFGDITFTRSGLSGTAEFPTVTTYAAKIGFSLGFPK